MLNHACRRASRIFVVPLVGSVCLFGECDARAQSAGDLPTAQEPWLAEPGEWAADFNDAQLACYQGSMRACDSIWLNQGVLLDSFLGKYGRSCGGRVEIREIADLTCTQAFPDHE
jgi:hypothetical protein